MTMKKIEYRVMIKYFLWKERTNDEIKLEFTEVYEESAPPLSII